MLQLNTLRFAQNTHTTTNGQHQKIANTTEANTTEKEQQLTCNVGMNELRLEAERTAADNAIRYGDIKFTNPDTTVTEA